LDKLGVFGLESLLPVDVVEARSHVGRVELQVLEVVVVLLFKVFAGHLVDLSRITIPSFVVGFTDVHVVKHLIEVVVALNDTTIEVQVFKGVVLSGIKGDSLTQVGSQSNIHSARER